jgi:hypothetical protein
MLTLYVHCLPSFKRISLKVLDKQADINLASIRILDTLDGRVQISYLRRSNRINSIKRKERLCTLECQFRAAAIGLCYKFPDLWIIGMRLLCGCRTRVSITSTSLESDAFCSSVRWNLRTPKIIRIQSLSVWRDNERKPRILLLNYGWASNDGKGSKQIHHRYELVWSEVTASTGLSWNVSSRLHWQTRRHILRNTFNFKALLYRIRQNKTQRSVRFQTATHFFMHSASVHFIVSTHRGKWSNRIRGAR